MAFSPNPIHIDDLSRSYERLLRTLRITRGFVASCFAIPIIFFLVWLIAPTADFLTTQSPSLPGYAIIILSIVTVPIWSFFTFLYFLMHRKLIVGSRAMAQAILVIMYIGVAFWCMHL